MKKAIYVAILVGGALALSACGSSEDASTEAVADTVEMPAAEALEPIDEEPVADPSLDGPPLEEDDTAVSETTASEAADNAADVAAQAEAAAAEAEAAASAAEGLDNLEER
ncbi:MAG: hypothetical protein V2I27_05420 [Erythrobacter sp.]|jgi:hypothetical protein|nr:hypothetical protein [Erythrobacter sp.]